MGNNYHTPWTTSTRFRQSEMQPPLTDLDKALTYLKRPLVSCDGAITYDKSTGTLAWSDTLRIYFIREDGQTILNTVSAGSVVLADGYFAYLTLNETNNTVITVSTGAATGGAASNFLAPGVLVLGYRNASSDDLYPVNLPAPLAASSVNPYDITLFYPGVPTDSALMLRVKFPRAVSFAANFAGSYAAALTAATAETVFEVQKNDAGIGTITFAAAGTSGTFASSGGSAVSFAPGDILSVVSPSTADATLAHIGITLAGAR